MLIKQYLRQSMLVANFLMLIFAQTVEAKTMTLDEVNIGQAITINGRKYIKITEDNFLAAERYYLGSDSFTYLCGKYWSPILNGTYTWYEAMSACPTGTRLPDWNEYPTCTNASYWGKSGQFWASTVANGNNAYDTSFAYYYTVSSSGVSGSSYYSNHSEGQKTNYKYVRCMKN